MPSSSIAALRATDELRRQLGIVIYEDGGRAIGNYPVEFMDEETFSALRSPSLQLLLTKARAEALGLAAQDIRIDAQTLSLEDIRALCDPLTGQKPLPEITSVAASAIDSMALALAKHASILPALLLTSEPPANWLRLSASELRRYIEAPPSEAIETARASLPLDGAEHASVICFRERYGTAVHLALLIGDVASQDAPLVRIHSSCVTGDILGSLRCDCGDQLKLALDRLREGGGILIYLHQEGRGIGISNKLRAYALQERGCDTYEANRMLGFGEDERDFSIAGDILKKLGAKKIRLLTNNPHKLAAIEKTGIAISERVPLVAPPGKHNQGYLEAKGKKAGHLL